jgi:hypothetical protein
MGSQVSHEVRFSLFAVRLTLPGRLWQASEGEERPILFLLLVPSMSSSIFLVSDSRGTRNSTSLLEPRTRSMHSNFSTDSPSGVDCLFFALLLRHVFENLFTAAQQAAHIGAYLKLYLPIDASSSSSNS